MDIGATLEAVRDYWHRKSTLIVVAIGFLLAVPLSFGTGKAGWVVSGVLLTLLASLWFWTNRLPRSPATKIGIGLAISCEDRSHRIRLRSDLSRRLRDHLSGLEHGASFALIEFPEHVASRLAGSEDAPAVTRRSRLNMMIFGQARMRKLPEGRSAHVLNLHGIVSHRPLPAEVCKKLGQEFREVLPQGLVIPEEGDFLVLEATAQMMDAVARYMVGIAAAVSHDFESAENLFKSILLRLPPEAQRGIPQLDSIRGRVPERLLELYSLWMGHLTREYIASRDEDALVRAERVVSEILQRAPRDYSALLTKAMCAFVLRRDVTEARRHLQLCSSSTDATWRYSVAFLLAYEGSLRKATQQYLHAFKSTLTDQTVPIQTEEFMQHVLEKEPERYELHYCMGMINYRIKRDFVAAERDLQAFLEACSDATDVNAVRRAKKMLSESRRQLRVERGSTSDGGDGE